MERELKAKRGINHDMWQHIRIEMEEDENNTGENVILDKEN
ncbi:MAG: hypothetical protein Q8904_00640 [Bacteroidota bacterium]|nr:hypothetical protein [Bacteroidota bacterium]